MGPHDANACIDAWLPRPPVLYNSVCEGEADAYLLLDQDSPVTGLLPSAGHLGVVQQMMPDVQAKVDSGMLGGWMNDQLEASPRGSPRQGEQEEQDKRQGTAVGSSKGGRKSTSLAQREAHKRYRERKKQSIAAMEAAVEAKRYELEQLQAENEQLKSKARVLETAERCSVEIHELMKLLDGLQSLSQDEFEVSGADRGGSSCTSRPKSGSMTAAAAAGNGHRSSTDNSSQEALPVLPALDGSSLIPAAAAGPGMPAPSAQQGSFLQTLLNPAQQQASTTAVQVKQEQQVHAQANTAARLSLQDEDHWLQMAQRYLDFPEPQQAPAQAAPAAAGTSSAAAGAAVYAGAGVAAPAAAAGVVSTPAAADAGLARACAMPSLSDAAPSETTESSSSVLSELGSVDTPEQGLVVYKAFLQQASELLALAQQQQQKGQADTAAATEQEVGELTRTTIGRLQPFLVARGQGIVYDWNARNLATQQPEEPPDSLWPAVLDALQLTAETQRDALQCFELFGAPLSRLLEERAQLAQRYRELQTASADSASSSAEQMVDITAAKTLESVAWPMITSAAVLRALAANLERYQSLDGVFAHSLTNLLTGAQIAAACVASYPYLPRWHSMMAALKQRKEEEAQQQLGGMQGGQQRQRRSGRVRVATQAAREAYA